MSDKNPRRDQLVKSVTTPIAFFSLVVLVTESILGLTAAFIGEGKDRTILVVSAVSILTLLILIVALLAFFRPWVLSGQSDPGAVIERIEVNPPPYSNTTAAIRYFLRGIRESYLHTLDDTGRASPKHVRLNVMLVVSSGAGKSKENVLAIKHVDYPGSFTEDEFNSVYSIGKGKCGEAWKLLQLRFYAEDREEPDAQPADMDVDSPTARSRKSVLSSPLLCDGECIGVLNLDSDEDSSSTYVHLPVIHNLFASCAQEIVPFLFPASTDGGR